MKVCRDEVKNSEDFAIEMLIFTSSNIRMKSSVVILMTRCEVDFHEIIFLISCILISLLQCHVL